MVENFENPALHRALETPIISPDTTLYIYEDRVYMECPVKAVGDLSPSTHRGYCTLGTDGRPNYKESGLVHRVPSDKLPGLQIIFEEGRQIPHSEYFANFNYQKQQ